MIGYWLLVICDRLPIPDAHPIWDFRFGIKELKLPINFSNLKSKI